jgi:beta-phosphoglucomutase-like phosphatase (HAD superfamily)
MNIALFDIDGTLTASNEIDSDCRADAFRDVFGFELNRNWDDYEHTTDRGIAVQALREHGHEATEHDLSLDRSRCVQLLTERMTKLEEIPGAGAFLAQLLARDWHIALCTGAWGDSARLKLLRAGLPTDLPLAACDEEISREAILRRGIALVSGTNADTIVSFGDAPWDVRAARNLHLPLIGIAQPRGQRNCAEAEQPRYSRTSAMQPRCLRRSIALLLNLFSRGGAETRRKETASLLRVSAPPREK